jgi:hypothetical protein
MQDKSIIRLYIAKYMVTMFCYFLKLTYKAGYITISLSPINVLLWFLMYVCIQKLLIN